MVRHTTSHSRNVIKSSRQTLIPKEASPDYVNAYPQNSSVKSFRVHVDVVKGIVPAQVICKYGFSEYNYCVGKQWVIKAVSPLQTNLFISFMTIFMLNFHKENR